MNNLTLILNADDNPLNITNVHRAFNLVWKGKATVVTHDLDNPFVCGDQEFKRPTIIRLNTWVYIPYRKAMPLTRHNIYRRDGHKCVYCESTKRLTLDHVLPKSRGGKNTWENLVTCCAKCNGKKDNKTPKEAGMTMLVKPYVPSYINFLTTTSTAHDHWVKYFEDKKRGY